MPTKDAVKGVNALLQEQQAILRSLADMDIARLEKSDKATDQLRGRLAKVNQQLDDSKKSGGLSSLGKSVENMLPGIGTLVGFAHSLYDGLARNNREAVSLAVNFGRISLADATKQQGAFENSATRMAASMGTSFASVQSRVKAVADETNESQDEIYAFARSTKDVAGGFDNALDRAVALSKEARELGITFAEASDQFGTALSSALKPGEGFGVLRSIAAEAEKLGTVGGPRALEQQLASLSSQIKGMNAQQLKEAGAFFGTVTKGLDPERAKEVQARIAGTLKGRAADIQRFSGVNVLNDQGELDTAKLPQAIRQMRSRIPAANREYAMQQIFGDAQTGRLLNRADLSESNLKSISSVSAAPTLNRLASTDVGKGLAAERREERERREEGQSVIDDGRRMQDVLAGMSPGTRDTVSTATDAAAKLGVSRRAISRTIGGSGNATDPSSERFAGIASAGLTLGGNAGMAQFFDDMKTATADLKASAAALKDSAGGVAVTVNNASDQPVTAVANKKNSNTGKQ
jgi:hypothetical protein